MTAASHMQCLLEVVAAADRDMLSTGAADLADQQGVPPPVLHSLVQGSVVPSVEAAAADLEWPLLVDMYPYDHDTESPSPVDMVSDAASSSAGRPNWAIAPRDMLSIGTADLADQQGVARPVLPSLLQGSVVPSFEAAASDVTDVESDKFEWPFHADKYPYEQDTEPPSPAPWSPLRRRVLLAGQGGPLHPTLGGGVETYRRRSCRNFGKRRRKRESVKRRGRNEDQLRLMVIDLCIGGVRFFEKVTTAAFSGMRTAAVAGENTTPRLRDPAPWSLSTLIRGRASAKSKTRAKAEARARERAKAMSRTRAKTRSELALRSHHKTVLHSLSVVERALRVRC